jgi:hypothetical protein
VAYQDVILATPGLVAYWRLGEASGLPQDSKGTNHATVIGGTPTYGVPGAVDGDNAIEFDPGDWFIIPDAAALDLGNFPWTIEIWMKRLANTQNVPFSKANQFELIWDGSNRLYLGNQSTANVWTTRAITDTNWHHYVFTRPDNANNTNRVYIDGVDDTSTSTGSAYAVNAAPLTLGGRGSLVDLIGEIITPLIPTLGFTGALDEIALYNVALTPAQVLAHYQARLPPAANPTVTITGNTNLDVLTVASSSITAATQFDVLANVSDLQPLPPRFGLQRLAGGAVIEIRTVIGANPSLDTWADIACEVVSARTIWGAVKSAGYLTQAEGGFLELEIYDPNRLLDPSNIASPYYAVLKPGLWIRFYYVESGIRTLIKWARVDSIGHTITTAMGRISAHDWVSVLSNNPYPSLARSGDTSQWSTLHTFATGILALAWQPIGTFAPMMPVTVEYEASPIAIKGVTQGFPGPDVWTQITDHAIATFNYAWIDPSNVMHFAPLSYTSGGQIIIGVAGSIPLEFISQSDAANIFNNISVNYNNTGAQAWAFDEASQLTWGVKQFTSPPTPPKPPGLYDAREWAEKFLADRAQPAMDALPLRIWPTSPNELRSLIGVQGMNSVIMQFDSVSPAISLLARAIGARVSVDSDGWAVELFTWLLK